MLRIYYYLRPKFIYMAIKNYTKLLSVSASIVLLVFTVSSCKKDTTNEPVQTVLNLPSEVNISYGEITDIALPAELIEQSDVTFRVEFNETNNIQINSETKLRDKLVKAIEIDREAGKIHIDSRLLYPNDVISSITGNKLPENYKITVIAGSLSGRIEGRQTFDLKIIPGKLLIKDIDNSNDIPYAYVLYNDRGVTFELEAPSISTDGSNWYLPVVKDAGSLITLNGNQLKFAANAGDPKQQSEHAYDLEPALQKDGFTIASRKFRVIFIPQIKFFFGTYYPEYNLTVLVNLVHIGLSNGYISSAPTLYPEKYKSTFSISSIQKDGEVYQNSEGIFAVNSSTGSVTVKQNTTLKAGRYKLIIKALTTTGLEFSTDLTLVMEAF